ncbi:SHOCT domain-containing protein [Microlunatus elymi]|uniref:SHOCT domain-containing protein n=1 Tax=Microlunatus elymi TaxID=2596828 RepID=A0A516Q476_9ACTN|nr:SHOCT domain-containing protein [Microlunatus elymi]QDP98240.1 SHOCT domain-containing protein [Microlunatus elymi]
MGRPSPVRSRNSDLLTRSLPIDRTWPMVASVVVDQVEQLRELARLADEGMLSAEELERQRRRVLND